VNVFDDETALDRRGELTKGRNLPVWEDVGVDPGVSGERGFEAADGVEEEEAVGGQAAPCGVEESGVVLQADVLEHADGCDRVDGRGEAAVVLEEDLYGKAGAVGASEAGLPAGDGETNDTDAVTLDGEAGEASPAAADVEERGPRDEVQLAADEVVLGELPWWGRAWRGRDRCRDRNVCARLQGHGFASADS